MSYLSASENVGFSGIPQNISDASCATQYKMAVEGVSTNCSEVNMFIHDNSGDEQSYITLNDNFYTKFKIDPNELYTFHDSDVIAGEITVSHTEDNFIFPDNIDVKSKLLDSPSKDLDLIGAFTNGDIEPVVKKKEVENGHLFSSKSKSNESYKDNKTTNTKVAKSKSHNLEHSRSNSLTETRCLSVHSPKSQNAKSPSPSKTSINSVNSSNGKQNTSAKQSVSETFLDVFKREQGLVENGIVVKTETPVQPPVKVSVSPPKKTSSGKTPSHPKGRRGRGPALHEALQRIPAQRRVIPIPNSAWHAPGESLFSCGPLDDKQSAFRTLEGSSSDDDNMPDFESGCGAVCVEESAAESRGARLELRRAALRRHVGRAHSSLRLAATHDHHRELAKLIKMQLSGKGPNSRLPAMTVNQLLAMRGMPTVLTSQERRRLRASGWSGGESGSGDTVCAEEGCCKRPLPMARHCLPHVTREHAQRLYVPCAAVFAGGARCNQPLLPLHDQTPLCTEHAWKRDNYDKLSRDCRPKKAVRVRPPPAARAPRRAPRRRPPARRPRPAPAAPLSPPDHPRQEINVCSNSSAYDSSEDTTMGTLSDNEYITVPSNSHELEVEVGHVPADDILDPAVLSQIPDEAFTEFFNQAEGGTPFAESSELAAALEAVLDERTLDNINDCVFPHSAHLPNKVQVPAPPSMEMSSSAPS